MAFRHTVNQGDCILSLAEKHGFFPDTIWGHPENSSLQERRQNMGILQPGDEVYIPDQQTGEHSGGTEQRHRFRRKGVPALLRIVFYRPMPTDEQEDAGEGNGNASSGGDPSDESTYVDQPPEEAEDQHEPISGAPYILYIDGKTSRGKSDAEGLVEVPIPLGARTGKITFQPGTEDEIQFDLDLGQMDSIETVIGARKRLYNMGYRCAPTGDELDDELKDAVRRFQAEQEIETTGEFDQATRDRLCKVHGS